MNSEVICLSSDEEEANSSIKNPNETRKVEKSAQKRKLPFFQSSSTGDAKKLKVEKKESPQQGCSRDMPQVFSSGDATKQEVENIDCPLLENVNDLTQVFSNGNDTKQKFEKMELSQTGGSTSFDSMKENRKVVKPQLVAKTKIPIPLTNEDVFKNFVEMCSSKKDDADTREILQKLKKSYDMLSSAQKDNSEFRLFISGCHKKVAEGLSSGIYGTILDLYNEIKKINPVKKAVGNTAETYEVLVSEEDEKKIKLLEHAIKQCKEKIQKLEDADVEWDDDKNSAFIVEDKYKKKLIQLCNELSKLTGDKAIRKQILKKKIKIKDIQDEMTGIKLFDEEILKFINSNVNEINQLKYLENKSIAGHLTVPEYLDVLECIQKCNTVNKLDFDETTLKILAKKAFEVVAKFLKKKRVNETKSYLQSLEEDEGQKIAVVGSEDPAVKDENLNEMLGKSKREGDKKLDEIFMMYTNKQEFGKQESLNHLDVEKQAETGFEDESESNTENKSLDENLSFEEKTNKFDGKEKLDSNLPEKSLIDNNEGKIETKTQAPLKDVDETNEVIDSIGKK